MRAVVQRVSRASVTVDDREVARIGKGLLVFIGVANEDGPSDVHYMTAKIRDLRIFPEDRGARGVERGIGTAASDELGGVQGPPPSTKMNRSVTDADGAVLLVSQFTLLADARKGRRPSFDPAAPPQLAQALYEEVARELRDGGLHVETGVFQAGMAVELVNDGPVTILLDSRKLF